MAELPIGLAAALRADRALMFGSVEIILPGGYALRLLDGSGEVMVGDRKFVGRDPLYGTLDTIKGLAEALNDSAPTVSLGLIPASNTALATLIDPAVQGATCTIAMGCIDPATGSPVSDSYVLFVGELDVPTVTWAANDRRLEYRVASVAERLFMVEEGRRLSDAFHQKVWPGELGLGFVTDVETWVPWGQKLDMTQIQTRTNLPNMGGMTWSRT